MSFGSFFKKFFTAPLKLDPLAKVDPIAKAISGKLNPPKPGSSTPAASPTYTQQDLANEENNYNGIADTVKQGVIDRAKAAGTYSDSAAFKDAINAEAGAATRQEQYQSIQKQNAIRKYLGMPTLPVGMTPSAPGVVTATQVGGTNAPTATQGNTS